MVDNTSFGGYVPSTPEQVKQLRDYATKLQEGAIAPTSKSGWGVLAQALMGLQGANLANRATGLQQQGIQSATQQDPNLAMLVSRGLLGPQGSTGQAPTGALPFSGDLKSSILQQESGNNSNIGPSVAGAQGPGQIMPATFASAARPGENINNPDDNRAVSGRLIDGYLAKFGDPARAAVAYFSGPGNVAPLGSPTPWLADRKDANGKSVSSYVADVTGRMRQPQMNMAQNYTAYQHNPWANPAEQNLARGMITPTPGADVYGRPTVTSPMGGQRALPTGPGVQPGVLVPAGVSGEGGVTTQIPLMAPGGSAPPSLQSQLQPLVTAGQQFSQQGSANKAVRGGIESDVQAAQAAFPIMQNLDLMKNEIEKNDKIIFGPTAEAVTNLRKIVAQHAPGFMSPAEIQGLAAQDSLRKQTALLSTAVGRQTGNTDLSLLQGRESVPGEHNSREGAMAIIDMLKQQVGLNSRFVMENYQNYGKPGFDALAAKAAFYRDNPIINPLTKNPITVDLGKGEKVNPQPQTKTINGKVYTKIGDKWHEGL